MLRSLIGLLGLSFMLLAAPPAATQEQKDFFENHIRPLLAQNCFACHTNSQTGGLRLDSRESILKGGKSGPAVVPGAPDQSRLITAVRQTTNLKMPLGARLTEAQVEELVTWVKDRAVWPDTPQSSQTDGYVIRPDQRMFWSFQPLAKPEAPVVKDSAWSKNDIDRFIYAKLEQEGPKPAPLASKRALLRRVTYILTGLMPTEVKAFEADKSPDAYEKVVDHLMGSSHFGEPLTINPAGLPATITTSHRALRLPIVRNRPRGSRARSLVAGVFSGPAPPSLTTGLAATCNTITTTRLA